MPSRRPSRTSRRPRSFPSIGIESMMRVLVTSELPGHAIERLRAEAEVEIGSIEGDLSSFDALVTLLSDRIDAALLDRAPRVRLIANVAVGVDNVDLDACKKRGVRVTNTPGV